MDAIVGVPITAGELVVGCSPGLDRRRLGRVERAMVAVVRVAGAVTP